MMLFFVLSLLCLVLADDTTLKDFLALSWKATRVYVGTTCKRDDFWVSTGFDRIIDGDCHYGTSGTGYQRTQCEYTAICEGSEFYEELFHRSTSGAATCSRSDRNITLTNIGQCSTLGQWSSMPVCDVTEVLAPERTALIGYFYNASDCSLGSPTLYAAKSVPTKTCLLIEDKGYLGSTYAAVFCSGKYSDMQINYYKDSKCATVTDTLLVSTYDCTDLSRSYIEGTRAFLGVSGYVSPMFCSSV